MIPNKNNQYKWVYNDEYIKFLKETKIDFSQDLLLQFFKSNDSDYDYYSNYNYIYKTNTFKSNKEIMSYLLDTHLTKVITRTNRVIIGLGIMYFENNKIPFLIKTIDNKYLTNLSPSSNLLSHIKTYINSSGGSSRKDIIYCNLDNFFIDPLELNFEDLEEQKRQERSNAILLKLKEEFKVIEPEINVTEDILDDIAF
jgi:hypothetical protein